MKKNPGLSLPALFICLLLSALFMTPDLHASPIDLSKAVVIGNGPKTVIEFTDPDCPFCRKAAKYLESRKDVTKYVIFMALERHQDAKYKIRYILSQKDAVKAYYEVMSGKMDMMDAKNLPVTQNGIKLQETHQEIAKKAGVSATPTFMIYGRVVEGFDLPRIEELLGK